MASGFRLPKENESFQLLVNTFRKPNNRRPRRRKRGKYNVKSTSIFPRVFFHAGIESFDFLILCSDLTPNHSAAFVPPVLFSSGFWKKSKNIIRGNRSKKEDGVGETVCAKGEERREARRSSPTWHNNGSRPSYPTRKTKNEWTKFKAIWFEKKWTCAPRDRCAMEIQINLTSKGECTSRRKVPRQKITGPSLAFELSRKQLPRVHLSARALVAFRSITSYVFLSNPNPNAFFCKYAAAENKN